MSDLESIEVFCVCDEEDCWCPNMVTVKVETPADELLDVACPKCEAGHHVRMPE